MLREEHVTMQRKHLRKGGMMYYNGVHMTVEDLISLQNDMPEDEEAEDTSFPEEVADES
jgi:hypothetical protein